MELTDRERIRHGMPTNRQRKKQEVKNAQKHDELKHDLFFKAEQRRDLQREISSGAISSDQLDQKCILILTEKEMENINTNLGG